MITVSTLAGTSPQVNTVPVGPDGFITIPLIGGVKAAGQTRSALAQEIAQKLKSEKIYVDPNVTVNVVDYNSRVVYITGTGIAKPGPHPLISSLKVSELIARAGGLKESLTPKTSSWSAAPTRINTTTTTLAKAGIWTRTFNCSPATTSTLGRGRRDART